MKRILILTFMLIASFVGRSQELDMNKSCEQAKKRASKDFRKGNMRITSYGLAISEDHYFDEFYHKYILENYQVEYANGGCIVWDALLCYEEKMLALIESKYGDNFLERTFKEALKEYKPRKAEIIEEYHKNNEDG